MSTPTVVADVRVFDGRTLSEPTNVVIDGGLIGGHAASARVVEGGGGVLLPGLIDAHVHLRGVGDLKQLRRFGVTTALDMACWPPELVDSLRGRSGLPDIRSAGASATSAGSIHSRMPGYPRTGLVDGPADAERFVAERVSEGSDYIKVIADVPGPDQATLDALVAAGHAHGKLVVAHAASFAAVAMAQRAGADVITHVPLDRALDGAAAAVAAAQGRVAVPTLSMMEAITTRIGRPGTSYASARASVAALHRAGVPVLAGTDANAAPGAPASVPHGESLHHELELLVDAGLSTVDALRAATVLPARHFGLGDRGAIEAGLRADLVLLDGDPLADIRATRQIRRAWFRGIEYVPTPPVPDQK